MGYSKNNLLSNCLIENVNGVGSIDAAISLESLALEKSTVEITGCTIDRGSGTAKVGIAAGSNVVEIQGNTIRGFDEKGISVASSIASVVMGNFLEENGEGIYVSYGNVANPIVLSNRFFGNTISDITAFGQINTSVVWDNQGVYRINGLSISGSLMIKPGTRVEIASGNISVYGSLDADGVTFTSRDSTQPWGGFRFKGSSFNSFNLRNCTIENVNGETYDRAISIDHYNKAPVLIENCTIDQGSGTAEDGISLSGDGVVEVRGNTIRGFDERGISISGISTFSVIDNKLEDNNEGIYVDYANDGKPIISSNAFSGNTFSDITVFGQIHTDVVWEDQGTYRAKGLSIWDSLTIEPGTTVELGLDDDIFIAGGTLIADGVTFTAADSAQPWGGITVRGDEGSEFTLTDCVVENVNGDAAIYIDHLNESPALVENCMIDQGTGSARRGISFWGDGVVDIRRNTIRGFDERGISIGSISTFSVTDNKLENNNEGIYISYGGTVNPIISGNTFSGNTFSDITAFGQIHTDVVWEDQGTYRAKGLSIWDSLTIEPGTTVELGLDDDIFIAGGTLIADGVTFTAEDSAQPWGGITVRGDEGSEFTLTDCVVENVNGDAAIHIDHLNDSPVLIENCMIDQGTGSARRGISFWGDGVVEIRGNTIRGFDEQGISIRSSTPGNIIGNIITDNAEGIYSTRDDSTFQNNIISGNTEYGFRYLGSGLIDATNNYWGDPSGPLDESDDRDDGGLYNPYGLGDRVSDRILYEPWLNIDPPKILAIPTNLDVGEGETSTFDIKLSTPPSEEIQINIASSGDNDISIQSATVLTFTPITWNDVQTVTVAAAEDADSTSGTAEISLTSVSLATVMVSVVENDNDVTPSNVIHADGFE